MTFSTRAGLAVVLLAVSLFALTLQGRATSPLASYHTAWPPYKTVTGAQSVIVITLDFSDTKGGFSTDYVEDLVFGRTNQYFKEVSYSQAWIIGNITRKWYELPGTSASYEWDNTTDPWRFFEPFTRAVVKLADDEVDYSKYRYVAIVHSGRWRNSWGFVSPYEISTKDGTFTLNVPIISLYHDDPVFAHELAHVFGNLPDMYAKVDNEFVPTFVGPWDLMSDTGRYVDLSAWSKMKIGWIQSSAVVTSPRGRTTNATIDPLELPDSRTYALKVPLTQGTYYLAEVRQNMGFDMGLPDHGLIVYFVDESKNEWGESPLVVQDSNPKTTTLDDATFDVCNGKQAGFFDNKNDVSIVIAGKQGLSYAVSAGPVSEGEMILAQTESRHNESCYYSQPFSDNVGDLFDEGGFPAKAEGYLDVVSTDIRRSGDSYLIELDVNGAMPGKIAPSLWIEWDIGVDADNNPDTGWTWLYNDIGVDYIIRVGILDSTYYPQVMKTQPTFHEIAKPLCQIKGSKILFTLTAAEFQMPSSLVWMVTAQKYGQRGKAPNPPFLAGDKAPNSRHFTTPIQSIRSVTETSQSFAATSTTITTRMSSSTPTTQPLLGIMTVEIVAVSVVFVITAAAGIFYLRRRRRTMS